jgi:hypothetical protein
MTETKRKKSPVFDYFTETEDVFAGGVAWCAGCTLELAARFVPKVLGKDILLVGCPRLLRAEPRHLAPYVLLQQPHDGRRLQRERYFPHVPADG